VVDLGDEPGWDGVAVYPPLAIVPPATGDASCAKSQDTILVGVSGFWKGF